MRLTNICIYTYIAACTQMAPQQAQYVARLDCHVANVRGSMYNPTCDPKEAHIVRPRGYAQPEGQFTTKRNHTKSAEWLAAKAFRPRRLAEPFGPAHESKRLEEQRKEEQEREPKKHGEQEEE